MNIRQPTISACALIAFFLATIGGCSPDFHKADADKEVYKIIDEKWHPGFGQKANYIISDSNFPAPNDLKVEKVPLSPEKISLSQAVAIATTNSRTYQTWKEDLYESALSLSGERHKYELQLFGTADGNGTYINKANGKNNDFALNSSLGASQDVLIGDGIEISTNLAFAWARFLTGDPRTTLACSHHYRCCPHSRGRCGQTKTRDTHSDGTGCRLCHSHFQPQSPELRRRHHHRILWRFADERRRGKCKEQLQQRS